jgi:DNA-binding NarL/FixJ family response regulator
MIISDVYMPVMDGFKLHKAVRSDSRWEKLPFLFVSAYADQYTLEAVRNPRYDGFLQKGKPTADLLAWINHMNLPEEERASKIPGLSTSGRSNGRTTEAGDNSKQSASRSQIGDPALSIRHISMSYLPCLTRFANPQF